MLIKPNSSARFALIYCSNLGSVLGIINALLSKDRISQKVLYPPIETIPAAFDIKFSILASKVIA